MLRPIDYSRVFWIGLAIVLAGILAVVIITFLGTFVLGLFLYYAARPIYVRLRRRIRPASLAAAIALFVLILPVILLFWYTVALGIRQLLSIGTLDLSAYETLLAPYLDSTGLITELRTLWQSSLANPEQLLTGGQLQGIAMELLATLSTYLGVVLTGLLHLFVALALAFYLLRDGDRLVEWVHGHFPNETLVTYGRTVDADLKTVFFGNILNALLTGTVAAIVFSLLGVLAPPSVPVPVPILLGLLAGAGSLVPVVGMKIVYVPVTLYLTGLAALSDPRLLWFPLVFFAVTFVVIDTIPDLVVRPYVSGRNLHVGAVMFAYIFGPLLFGWYGLFLGPLLLVLITDFGRVVVPELVGSSPGPDPSPPSPRPTQPEDGVDETDTADTDDAGDSGTSTGSSHPEDG